MTDTEQTERRSKVRNSWGGPFWWTRLLTLFAFVFSGVLILAAFGTGKEGVITAAIGFGKWVILTAVAAYIARAGLTDNLQKFINLVRGVS